ncbi:fimbrial protein, partial [Stenotrophomonas sp. 278]
MTLVLFAPVRDLAGLLGERLPVGVSVHWVDSAGGAAALDAHRRQPHCVVLLDFRRAAACTSTELARQLQRSQPELALVAVGSTTSEQVDGIVAAVRCGLRDILDMDTGTSDIDAVLRRAAGTSGTRATPAAAPHKARLVLVLGVRAGVGSSTLAAHLGVLAQQ